MNSMADTSSVQSVWQGFERKTFPAGATIFAEGDFGTDAFILLRGDVTLHMDHPPPRAQLPLAATGG